MNRGLERKVDFVHASCLCQPFHVMVANSFDFLCLKHYFCQEMVSPRPELDDEPSQAVKQEDSKESDENSKDPDENSKEAEENGKESEENTKDPDNSK